MNDISRLLNGPAAAEGTDRPPWAPPAGPQQVQVEIDRLREIQAGLPKAAEPLERAVRELVGLGVSEASFTSFTYSLAIAYNEVEAYTLQELKHRAEDAVRYHEMVKASADAWEAAEQSSTVGPGA
ncbi:hypothetical protein [Actinomadura xylanilytica]|uniref:hypothetical protein n=1 Tax=Actinomadura xylanilytica TaxID=887459 RepID=UPI00255A7FE5|nr:hypothetical protein [Actinomadura xylanilytica]MDL4772845.1 hypothetical protein [Actinomadura xylanilytica]